MYVVHEFPSGILLSVSDINFGLRKNYRFGTEQFTSAKLFLGSRQRA